MVRARIEKRFRSSCLATPSVETEVNARKGAISAWRCRRASAQHMPRYRAIDLRRAPPPRGRFISPPLGQQIKSAIEKREQALPVSQPPRYAPLSICRACGHRFACTICDAWLVDHRFRRRLVCHHLRFSMPARISVRIVRPRNRCRSRPRRRAPARKKPRNCLQEPHHGAVERPDYVDRDHAQRTERNREGRVDIIIGTQTGARTQFPQAHLVGVVDADLGLGNGDPRAAERTWQLLEPVNRARRPRPGPRRRYLQTHQPEHPVMKALIACDREAFYGSEIDAARTHGYPPFAPAQPDHFRGDRPTAEGFARNSRRSRRSTSASSVLACRGAAWR